MMEFAEERRITGVMVNYYFICRTKLWLFSRNLQMEREHENVRIGKFIHEDAYGKKKKNLLIDGTISLDFVEKGDSLQIHDVKKTKRMEEAHVAQMLYYLWYLRQRGVDNAAGVINYPLLRKSKTVLLDEASAQMVDRALEGIRETLSLERPPLPAKRRICRKCAYDEFCWGDEE